MAGLVGMTLAAVAQTLPRSTAMESAPGFRPIPESPRTGLAQAPLVEFEGVRFQRELQITRVTAMARGNGTLWFAALGQYPLDDRPTASGQAGFREMNRLWWLKETGPLARPVAAPMTNQVSDLAWIDDAIWAVVDGSAVVEIGPDGQVRRRVFGQPDQEPVALWNLAAASRHVFLLGEDLRMSDDRGAQWKRVPIPQLGSFTARTPGRERLLPWGTRIVQLGLRAAVFDPASLTWTRIDERDGRRILSPPYCGVADGKDFWLGGSDGLVRVHADLSADIPLGTAGRVSLPPLPVGAWQFTQSPIGETRNLPEGWTEALRALFPDPASRHLQGPLPGAVSSMALDAGQPWLASADPQRAFLVSVDGPSGSGLRGLGLPFTPPAFIVPVADAVWFGGVGDGSDPYHRPVLFRIRRRALPSSSAPPPTDPAAANAVRSGARDTAVRSLMAGDPMPVRELWAGDDEEDLLPDELFLLARAMELEPASDPSYAARLRERLRKEYPESGFTRALPNPPPTSGPPNRRRPRPVPAVQPPSADSSQVEAAEDRPRIRFRLDRRLAEIPGDVRSMFSRHDADRNGLLEPSEQVDLFTREPKLIPFAMPFPLTPDKAQFFFAARYLGSHTQPASPEALVTALENLAKDQAAGSAPRPE